MKVLGVICDDSGQYGVASCVSSVYLIACAGNSQVRFGRCFAAGKQCFDALLCQQQLKMNSCLLRFRWQLHTSVALRQLDVISIHRC